MDDLILLPSQQDLLERLQHNVYYGQQLQVLSGCVGSGKTRLLTQLASNIDDYDVAFIACPQHSEDAEIRRKIWVQLFATPVFDDETSLTDTLLNIGNEFNNPIIIILDDAHRLAHQLWAELLALSQMLVDNRPVAVVVSSDDEFIANFFELLPEFHQDSLLTLSIQSLSIQEQDALYLSLLANVNQQTLVGLKLNKPDFTVGERYIGNITKLFLNVGSVANDKINDKKNKFWLLGFGIGALILIVLAAFNWQFGWVKATNVISEINIDEQKIHKEVKIFASDTAILKTLKTINVENSNPLSALQEIDDSDKELTEQSFEQPNLRTELKLLASSENASLSVLSPSELPSNEGGNSEHVSEISAASNLTPTHPVIEQAVEVADERVVSDENTTRLTTLIQYPEGFTLQVATVSQRRSLNNILTQLKPYSAVKVARFNNRWVVLVGDFSDKKTALLFEAKLRKETSLPKPWLRKWKAIKQFEFQTTINEIEN
ncbi:MAG: AAA family ATPase [Shewanella sp.]|nr:AAA family ATPase [Shewanella sp.]